MAFKLKNHNFCLNCMVLNHLNVYKTKRNCQKINYLIFQQPLLVILRCNYILKICGIIIIRGDNKYG